MRIAAIGLALVLTGCGGLGEFLVPTTEEAKARRQLEVDGACLAVEEAYNEATLRRDRISDRDWALIKGYVERGRRRCDSEAPPTGGDVLALSVYTAQIARLTAR